MRERPPSTASEERGGSEHEEAGQRGADDRRGEVNPADNPAPRSPQPDEEEIRRGEEKLDRV